MSEIPMTKVFLVSNVVVIHTCARFAQAQNVENKKAESKTPHFLCLSQDIVAESQGQECGLQYVICTPS